LQHYQRDSPSVLYSCIYKTPQDQQKPVPRHAAASTSHRFPAVHASCARHAMAWTRPTLPGYVVIRHDTDHAQPLTDYYMTQLKRKITSVGYQNKGYPQSTIKKNKTTPKALPTKMGRAETANETPRPRSDSHEARSMGRLDHVPTRTRLA
jgi:hypothetical protein